MQPTLPRLKPGLLVEEVGPDLMVYTGLTRQVMLLNPTGARVFRACQAGHSPAELAQQLAAETGTGACESEALVRYTLQRLGKAGLLQEPPAGPGLTRRSLLQRGVAAALLPVVGVMATSSPAAAASSITSAACAAIASGSTCTGLACSDDTGCCRRINGTCANPGTAGNGAGNRCTCR